MNWSALTLLVTLSGCSVGASLGISKPAVHPGAPASASATRAPKPDAIARPEPAREPLTPFPTVLELSPEDARAKLKELGYHGSIVVTENWCMVSVEPGIVCGTTPPPDQNTTKGVRIRLHIPYGS